MKKVYKRVNPKFDDYTTEAEARNLVAKLLKKSGTLRTPEVRVKVYKHLVKKNKITELDLFDIERKVLRVEKITRNIVSHQKENTRIYEEGFIVRKAITPNEYAVFIPLDKKLIPWCLLIISA